MGHRLHDLTRVGSHTSQVISQNAVSDVVYKPIGTHSRIVGSSTGISFLASQNLGFSNYCTKFIESNRTKWDQTECEENKNEA